MIIQSKKVWVANNFNPLQIEIENEKIVAVYPYGTKEVDHDYGSLRVLPGFIDIHSHGPLLCCRTHELRKSFHL